MKANLAKNLAWNVLCMLFLCGVNVRASAARAPLPPDPSAIAFSGGPMPTPPFQKVLTAPCASNDEQSTVTAKPINKKEDNER